MPFVLQCPPVIRRRLGRMPVFGMMLACACFPYFLTSLPASLLDASRDFTGNLVVTLGRWFHINAVYSDGMLTVSGFAMRLILECTALHYLALVTAAILLCPGRTGIQKLHGTVLANTVIILANALRLLVIGVIGAHNRQLFDYLHDLFWQPVFVLLCIGIWAAWVEGKIRWRIAYPFLGTVAVAMYGLSLVKEPCMRLLVRAADVIMLLAQQNISFDNRIWLISRVSDSLVATAGGQVLYPFAGISVSYWQDLLAIAIFWGLMATSFAVSAGRSCFSWKQTVRGLVLGTSVLLTMILAEVTLVGLLLQWQTPQGSVQDMLWAARCTFLAVPVFLWFVLDGYVLSKLPPFEKGGQGGIFQRQSKANPPKSPFFKGGPDSQREISANQA
ncbi:MAG: exosortase/archaeosortase family protein [Geobacter sp.]|nr:exosortase/archaeosortase family protein [Geobacter sp.]